MAGKKGRRRRRKAMRKEVGAAYDRIQSVDNSYDHCAIRVLDAVHFVQRGSKDVITVCGNSEKTDRGRQRVGFALCR